MGENISLSELQRNIKEVLAGSFSARLWVRCEIHELKVNYSGHCYMTLVEKGERDGMFAAKAGGVVWSSRWKLLSSYFRNETGRELSAGMSVLFQVQVQYSELYGLSLVIQDVDPAYTLGEAEVLRLQTIRRLKEEGMFDMNRTLTLPRLPRRFALVTSASAAGYGDFLHHLQDNAFGFRFQVTLYASPMQGDVAPGGMIAALEQIAADMDNGAQYDAVLIMRGGGSVADLTCFDDYDLAANIAQFPLPVLTAIGHDKDVHISDMVACVSVKTPTALADFIIDALASEDALVRSLSSRLAMALSEKFRTAGRRLDSLENTLRSTLKMKFLSEKNRLDRFEMRIRAADPYEKMKKGYNLIYAETGPLLSARQVKKGESLKVMLRDGIVDCSVDDIRIMEKQDGRHDL